MGEKIARIIAEKHPEKKVCGKTVRNWAKRKYIKTRNSEIIYQVYLSIIN